MAPLLASVLALRLLADDPAADPGFPGEEWTVSDPVREGLDPGRLAAMWARLEAEGAVSSVLLVRHGRIAAEYNRPGFVASSIFPFWSCTKSVTSAAVGLALGEGRIRSLDDEVLRYLTPAERAMAGEAYRGVRIEHLLAMTSGVDWPESTDWNHGVAPLARSPNWVELVLGRRRAAPPGAVFNYDSGASHLLSLVVQRATGTTTADYVRRGLFAPVGMRSVTWPSDPQGVSMGGFGIAMTTRDAARFGYLYLRRGRWKGSAILPADFVDRSTTARSAGARWGGFGGRYGYHWWIGELSGQPTFFAWGAREQYVFVVPGMDLVAVFTSDFSGQSALRPPELMRDYVIPSVTSSPPR